MTAELRRQGMLVNHKRVARIMRDDSLLGTQWQSSRILSDARERDEVYINLGNRMKLTGTNQLWVADITLVPLKRGFVFLEVVLDRFSRKVVGWNLDRTMTARLTLAALEKALKERRPQPGLVHLSSITPDVSRALKNRGFFKVLDDTLCPISPDQVVRCTGDFSNSKAALLVCGFPESDYGEVFGVLMALGAYCDCEVLYNTAEDNRLKAQYWKSRHTALGQSDSQALE